VAVAIFDHCSVEFFDLSRGADGKLNFTLLPGKHMQNIHKFPVKQIRLSKKQPHLMVSCGDESDLYIKLWNLASSKTEPVNQFQSNQIQHKYMVQGHHDDYFSVAAKSSEIRLYQPVHHQGTLKGVSKIHIVNICIAGEGDDSDLSQTGDAFYRLRQPLFSVLCLDGERPVTDPVPTEWVLQAGQGPRAADRHLPG
jgi:hypothetical protein